MRVIWNGTTGEERIVALGAFDGVHRGHRELLETGLSWGREHGIPLRACTFDRHPLEVIRPAAAPKLLTTLPEKIGQMAEIGVDELRIMRFPWEKANQEPEDFLQELRKECRLRAVIAGWNYTFGRQGRGDAELLRLDGKQHGYEVLIIPPVKSETGITISSTETRKALEDGDVSLAMELLGRPYSLCGMAGEGKHLGNRIGFSTASVEITGKKQLPAFGVYACLAECDGRSVPAMAQISRQRTEVHLLEGHCAPQGKTVRLRLVDRLREERLFSGLEALKEQLEKDRKEALFLFGMA